MVVRDFGRIQLGIETIAITSDDKYLFVGGLEKRNHIKQFSVRNGRMIKDHGLIFENDGVWSMTTTSDNKWLFAAGKEGYLKQISLQS
jgi:WD40 repeat protein